MKLSQALRLSNTPRVALVGAGGKSTAMFLLARELAKPVLLSTTTHLSLGQLSLADYHYTFTTPDQIPWPGDEFPRGVVVVTGLEAGAGRVGGVSESVLNQLFAVANSLSIPFIIEADGSRQLPVKAPARHEPVIPEFVDTVVVMAGLSALGKPLSQEWVHRPERYAELSGLALGTEISPDAYVRVLTHPEGGLKNLPAHVRRVVLLNQADNLDLQAQAQAIAIKPFHGDQLLAHYQSVVIAALQDSAVIAVHEPVAAVILAAGGASRFGVAKQLLIWHGEPLVRRAARISLEAGLSPVVVVSGEYTADTRHALSNLDVQLVENPEWSLGQSTSIKAGLAVLPEETGAVIFLLADQPIVPASLLQTLREIHSSSLSPIVAPLVDGQRANPVLFDQDTFTDLASIRGDVGGRPLFAKFHVSWVPWHDSRLLLDIDTPEDYQSLLQLDA